MSKAMKIVAKIFNLFSINSFIGAPYFHKRNATIPNLIPLAIKLVTVNNTRISNDFYKIKKFNISGLNKIETSKIYNESTQFNFL